MFSCDDPVKTALRISRRLCRTARRVAMILSPSGTSPRAWISSSISKMRLPLVAASRATKASSRSSAAAGKARRVGASPISSEAPNAPIFLTGVGKTAKLTARNGHIIERLLEGMIDRVKRSRFLQPQVGIDRKPLGVPRSRRQVVIQEVCLPDPARCEHCQRSPGLGFEQLEVALGQPRPKYLDVVKGRSAA